MVSQEGDIFVLFEMNPGAMQSVLIIEGSWFRMLGLLLGEDTNPPPLYRWRALASVDLSVAERIVSDIYLAVKHVLSAWMPLLRFWRFRRIRGFP